MPIHECTLEGGGKGFQWGGHGTCYPTRAQAEKQAQAAYANGYTGDEIPARTLLTDSFVMDGVHRSKDGYLAAYANVARTGIQVYKGRELGRPDLGDVRVYRSPEEVFNKDAMKSFAHRPVTLHHPSETVNAKNWKKYSKGHTGDEVIRDQDHIKVSMLVMDSDAIRAIESGDAKELSMGYSTDLKWTPGKTADGQEYDAVQTEIRANHLAIVPVARGGKNLRFGDSDGTYAFQGTKENGPTNDDIKFIREYPTDENYQKFVDIFGATALLLLKDYDPNHDPHSGEFSSGSGEVNEDYEFQGNRKDGPTKSDMKFLKEYPTDTNYEDFVHKFGRKALPAWNEWSDAATDLYDANCPHCGAMVLSDADTCPACGADLYTDYDEDEEYQSDAVELEDEHLEDYNQNHDPRTGKFAPSSGGSSGPKRPRGRPRKDQSQQRPQAVHSSSAPEAPKIPENEQDLRAAGYRFHENRSPGHPALGNHYAYHDFKGFSSGPQPSRAHAVASAVEHVTGEMAPEIEAHRMALAQHELEAQHRALIPYEPGAVPHSVVKNIGSLGGGGPSIKEIKNSYKSKVFSTQEEAKRTILANRSLWKRARVEKHQHGVESPLHIPKLLGGETVAYWLAKRGHVNKNSKQFYKISHDALIDLTLEDSIVEIDDAFDPNQPRDDRGRWTESYLKSEGYHFKESGGNHNVGKNFEGPIGSFKSKEEAIHAASTHYAGKKKVSSPEEHALFREFEHQGLSKEEIDRLQRHVASQFESLTSFPGLNPPQKIKIDPINMAAPSFGAGTNILGQQQQFTPLPTPPSHTPSFSGGPVFQSVHKDELEAYIKQQREFWKKARIKTHVDVTHSVVKVEPGFFRRVLNIEKTKPVRTERKYYSIGHDGAVVDAETDDLVIHNIDQGESNMSKMITIDGVPVETTDVGAAVVQRYIEKMNGEIKALQDAWNDKKKKDDEDDKAMDGFKKSIEAKDGEILALKKQLVDAQAAANPERLDALVKDRSIVIDSAKLILDASFVFDGKKSEDIRRAAVSSKLGDATVKEMTDAAIEGAFKALTVDAKKQGGGTRPIARALFDQQSNSPSNGTDMRDAAFADQEKYLNNAWKTPAVRN